VAKLKGVRFQTGKFRANWVHVIKPRPKKSADEKTKYTITMLFEKGQDLTELKKAIFAAGVEAWGADTKKWPRLKSTPMKNQGEQLKRRDDGTEFLPDGLVAGAYMMEAHTYNTPPGCVDQQKIEITDETQFYSGCYARASVVFKVYDFQGTGITCYLQNVQKWADGKPLAGRPRAEDEFSAIEVDPSVLDGGEDAGAGAGVGGAAGDPLAGLT